MAKQNNIYDLLGKIEWEGGVYEALDYGLHIDDYDVPDELAEKWEELEDCFDEFQSILADVMAILNRSEREYDENKEY